MNYKLFPEDYWKKIETTLSELKKTGGDLIAAFDADGTLWDTDLGENFFNFQIENQSVALPNDPWNHYLNLKKINNDPRSAYMWLAQINKKQPLDQIRQWADQAFNQIEPYPIFSEQKKLIELFKSHKVKIYIVTASVKWAVEPGARALGLTNEDVIGVETAIENNLITDRPLYPVTYREGKIEALLKMTKNIKPFFCSGNTIGDFELLNASTHLRLAVSAAARDDRLFKSEVELLEKAQQLNWWSHRFI